MKKSLVVLLVLVCLFGVSSMAFGINHAMWTHGTSLQVETPGNFVSDIPYGFYRSLVGKVNTSSWVHFQIPTPLIVDNVRLRADSVLLSFNTSSASAQVKAVHVYDGATKIASFENLTLSGAVGSVRFTLANKPLIYQGLNISVLTSFTAQSTINFVSAGCDFY